MSEDEIRIEIDKLEKRLFVHRMKDYFTEEDYRLADKLGRQIADLKEKLREGKA